MENKAAILELANAVVLRAIEDYKIGRMSYAELERFVRSDYFILLTRGRIDQKALLRFMEAKYGKTKINIKTGV